MSIIIAILILSYLGFDFAPQAFAEEPQKDSESPQTKVVIPPSTTSESNKEKQSLEEQKASLFLKAFGKKIPETYYPHDMKLVLDDNVIVPMVCNFSPRAKSYPPSDISLGISGISDVGISGMSSSSIPGAAIFSPKLL